MIVLCTSNNQGGIIQFTLKMLDSICSAEEEAVAFIPESSKINRTDVILYQDLKRIDLILKTAKWKKLNEKIKSLNPRFVLFTDDVNISTNLIIKLSDTIKTVLVIHDVYPHPTYLHSTLKKLILKKVDNVDRKKALTKASSVMLLSENSRHLFVKEYPEFSNKITFFRLGAHIPDIQPCVPEEMKDNTREYFLFIGRIDKYKGIARLLKAYAALNEANIKPLIIAGGGILSEEEKHLISMTSSVIVINRFIEDNEFLGLIKNASVVILPYIEASQSGILPIAYSFGIPVVVSNIQGLIENVIDKKTGFIFDKDSELVRILQYLNESVPFNKDNILEYYEKNFNWDNNVKKMLEQLKTVLER